jgi:hypothetical protein
MTWQAKTYKAMTIKTAYYCQSSFAVTEDCMYKFWVIKFDENVLVFSNLH